MATDRNPPSPDPKRNREPKKKFLGAIPCRPLLAAVFLTAVSIYYLAWVAPASVPVDPGLKVPFPEATRVLEKVCTWCGAHSFGVVTIGLALILPGFFVRFTSNRERYYTRLAIVVGLLTFFTYLSISAPIDRLIHAVESGIPKDNRVPDPATPQQ